MTGKKTKEERKQSNMDGKSINQQPSNEERTIESHQDSSKADLNHDNVTNEAYEKLTVQSIEYFEGWQRERADFLNYKKRIERDQLAMKNYLTGEVLKKYIAIVDDMELALKNIPNDNNYKEWVDGIGLIYQKLISILENEGVERISTTGQFDPNRHEALTQIDSPAHESGQIVDVMRQGYKIGDRILRPSLVIVAR
ncbi:MAG: nucleotide exchange factor GrpE [Anaerolineaceae bacterium]|nr:nucleotide exchange factor GrpE [Anaerolineaceae bacterium]